MQRLITAMRAAGVRPTISDGRLVIDRPDALDAALLQQIARNEPAIVEFFQAARGDRDPPSDVLVAASGTLAPLTDAQSGVLFVDGLHEGAGLFNVVTEIEIRGLLDLAALVRALTYVLRRHPILTSEPVTHCGVLRWRERARPVKEILSIVDAGDTLTPSRRRELCGQLKDGEQRRKFTGSSSWLHVTLVRYSTLNCCLLVCRHHVASDGWSFAVLSRELEIAYRAYARQREPQPDGHDAREFWNYCRFIEHKSQDPAAMAYWLTQLADAPRRIEFNQPSLSSNRAATTTFLRFSVPKSALEPILRQKITSYTALLGTFALVLYRASEQRDLLIGTDATTRVRPAWERIVGMFVNRLVLRVVMDDRATIMQLLRGIQELCARALTYRYTSLDRLTGRLGLRRGSGLFNVMFGLHNNPHHDFQLDDCLECRVSPPPTQLAAREVDLSLYFMTVPTGFDGLLAYDDLRFDDEWTRAFADRYCRLAAELSHCLEEPVCDVVRCIAPLTSVDPVAAQWEALYAKGAMLSFRDDPHDA